MEQSGILKIKFYSLFTYFSLYSYLFVVVTTNNETSPSQIPDNTLVSYSEAVSTGAGAGASHGAMVGGDTPPLMYVAAVLSNKNGDLEEKMLVLGDESISRNGDKEYYNAPLDREHVYYTFIRAYANNHTDSVSHSVWFILCDACYRTQDTHLVACLNQLVSSL